MTPLLPLDGSPAVTPSPPVDGIESGYWSDRRVLVTGGTGFLGSHIVAHLEHARPEMIAAPGSSDYDLRDVRAIRQALRDTRPNIVIHAAGRVGGIGANLEHPAEFFYDNLMMGIQLLHESWAAGVQRMVVVGTVCAYPKHVRVPFMEKDLWDGYPEETNAPYGLAKKMLLVQSQAYRSQYGFDSIFLLPANMYGPGDNFDAATSHVIPALIKKCEDARLSGSNEIEVWGDGTPTREFLYVDDAAEGILLAAEKYESGDPVNVGTGEDTSIASLADLIAQETGFGGRIRWNSALPGGQPTRRLDVSRAREEFGFSARTPLRVGLRRTIDWYRACGA